MVRKRNKANQNPKQSSVVEKPMEIKSPKQREIQPTQTNDASKKIKSTFFSTLKDTYDKHPIIWTTGVIVTIFISGFGFKDVYNDLTNKITLEKGSYKSIEEFTESIKIRDEKYNESIKRREDYLATETVNWKYLHKREVSYVIRIIETFLAKDDHQKNLDILGINCLGPIHQGREIFNKIINTNGKVRLLLLDPYSSEFKARMQFEEDSVGRIAAEGIAFIYNIKDLVQKLPLNRKESLDIRFYKTSPDRSLVIVQNETKNGTLFFNPYSKLKKERGLTGELYKFDSENEYTFKEHTDYFNKTWESAEEIDLEKIESKYLEFIHKN